jgi:hypothetical protein
LPFICHLFIHSAMMILTTQNVIHRHGHAIIRPADRSCWILVSPCGRYRSQYETRREAVAAAIAAALARRQREQARAAP